MIWLLDKLVDWWMSHCSHNDDDVAADLLEGAGGSIVGVHWCRRCGAVALNGGDFRRPRPLWAEPYNTRSMRRDALADTRRLKGLQ